MRCVIYMLLLALCSCHNDDNNIIERMVVITIKYEDEFGLHGDSNACVYVYYGIYSTDIANFVYSSGGNLVKNNQLISPNIVVMPDSQGNITLKLASTSKITIIAESSYYINERIVQSYSPGYIPITDSYIFRDNQ